MLLAVSTVCFAGQSVRIERNEATVVAVNAITLDADPTTVTSSAVNVQGVQRIGVHVSYDETEVGGVSGTFSATGSLDGTTYFTVPFFDAAGGATPQTTESLTADVEYLAWVDSNLPLKYLKVTLAGTGTDADDTIVVTINVYLEN